MAGSKPISYDPMLCLVCGWLLAVHRRFYIHIIPFRRVQAPTGQEGRHYA